MVDIRLASTASEREEIFRFRYQVYVLEQGRRQRYADHARQQIIEPLDSSAALLGAWRGSALVGTLRINCSRDGNLCGYDALYAMARVGRYHPTRTAITTKFVLHPRERGHAIAVRLCVAAFSYGTSREIAFNFIDCNPGAPRIIEFFEALGYVRLPDTIEHDEYGTAIPLVLCLADRDHLEAIRSPFRKLTIPADPEVVRLHRRSISPVILPRENEQAFGNAEHAGITT